MVDTREEDQGLEQRVVDLEAQLEAMHSASAASIGLAQRVVALEARLQAVQSAAARGDDSRRLEGLATELRAAVLRLGDMEVESGNVGTQALDSLLDEGENWELVFHPFRPVVDTGGKTVSIGGGRWEQAGGYYDFLGASDLGSTAQPYVILKATLNSVGQPTTVEAVTAASPPAADEWYTMRLVCYLEFDANGVIKSLSRQPEQDVLHVWPWFFNDGGAYDPNRKNIAFCTRVAVATYNEVKGLYYWQRLVDLTWGRGVINGEIGPTLIVAIDDCPEEEGSP